MLSSSEEGSRRSSLLIVDHMLVKDGLTTFAILEMEGWFINYLQMTFDQEGGAPLSE